MYLTFADLVEHLIQYAGADPAAQNILNARSAAQTALRVLSNTHQWNYYNTLFNINTNGPFNDGTIEYDLATNTVTLTGGTWPTWAAYGYLVFSNSTFAVQTRVSATQLTLASNSNPGVNVASGTAYNLRRDTYPLPLDFGSASSATVQPGIYKMTYVTDATAMTGRNYNVGTGRPQYFAVIGDPQRPQAMACRLWPAPDSAYHVQFTYRRKIVAPTYLKDTPGLVTCTDMDQTIAGTAQTEFINGYVGAAIRLSSNSLTYPTGIYGDNPAVQEFVIQTVTNANALETTVAASENLSNVKYVITSLLDLEPDSMTEYLLRQAEQEYRLVARMKSNPDEMRARIEAYERAREADNRFFGKQTAGPVVRAGVFDFVTVIPAS